MSGAKKGLTISAIAFLLVFLIGANAACYMFFDTITTYLCGSGINFEGESLNAALAASDDLIRDIQEEGTVLVKNDEDCLPLTKDEISRVNVFGWRHINNGWIAGASGSVFGNNKSNLERVTTLLEGLEANNIEWNTNLTKMYEDYYNVHDGKCLEVGEVYYAVSEPDSSYYTEELIREAQEFSNVAIVVIGRNGGEGADLPLFQQVRKADGSIEKRTDRNYLELTKEEEDMIKIVSENFEKTIVLINSVYACSYEFLDKYDVEACLWVSGGGQAGAYSIPKILNGKVNPSGRLTYTVPYDFRDDPSYYNGSTVGGSGAHASYVEDIYIGYRWFETADAENYWDDRTRTFEKTMQGGGTETIEKTGYDAVVQFPFGYGLSYTDFEWKVDNFTSLDTELKANSVISVDVTVTNVGNVKGKEVVQLYATPPYTPGGIEKSAVNLVAFGKTGMLRPGESETLTLTFNLYDLASYDCYDKNNNGFMGYELEAGDYVISLRNNSHDVIDIENSVITYTLENGIKIENDPITGAKVENRFTGNNAYGGMPIDGTGSNQGQIPLMTRTDFAGTFPTARTPDRTGSKVTAAKNYLYEPTEIERLAEMPTQGNGSAGKYLFYTKEDGSPANESELRTGNGLVINKDLMMELGNPDNYDSEKWEEVLNQLSINDMKILTKCGGYRTEHIVSVGKMYCFDNDGGSGMLRHINTNDAINPNREQWSLFGTTSMTAATWNRDLYYSIGNAIAAEGVLSGINGWYAPSCNLVRSPFGGRGSEYGSEDPLIAGMTAAEAVRAATANGIYTYVKHFAVNQSESGRSGKYTWLSEQSLRELYLKTFQITVQHGKTNGIMTAMNRLGATWTGGNHALVTGILRDEWGFNGCVITDYVDPKTAEGSYGWFKQGIYAGNDLFLSNASNRTNLNLGGWEDDPTYIGFIRKACKNILYSRANAYYVSQTTEVELGSKVDTDTIIVSEDPFAWWVVPLIGLDIVLVGAIVLLIMSLSGAGGVGKKILKLIIVILMAASVVVSAGYSYAMMTQNRIDETTVEAIVIKQLPTKLEYWEGELFDPTGLVLVVQYADGTINENFTEGFDWDLKAPLTSDNDEVKISVGTKAKYIEISVNIKTPISLTLLENPERLIYASGEKFSPNGMKLLATYDDGTERVITDGFMYPSTKLQEGTEFITIRYNGKSLELPIMVTKAAKIVSVTSGPIKTTYMAGQFFDPSGMVIIATFEDDSTMDITNHINLSTQRLAANDTKITFNVLGQIFEQAITVAPNPHVKANSYAEIPETCTEDGKKAHVTCSHCDKFFTDEYLAYEISDLTIEKRHILAAVESNPASGIQIRKCIRCESGESESPVIYHNFTKADIIDSSNTILTDTSSSTSKNIQNANQFAYRNQYMLNFKQEGDGVQFSFTADKAGRVTVVLKMSSALFKTIYRNEGERWSTGDMQLNNVANVKFNGVSLDIADNVILYGSDSLKGSVPNTTEGNQTYANTVNWQYIAFDVDATEGENTVTVQTKDYPKYIDINNTASGQASFALDTVAIYGDIFLDDSDTVEISDTVKEFIHNFTADDQSADNLNNPPEGRYSLTYHMMETASTNIKKALAFASNGDYLTHFYSGAAVTKTFTSTIEGKATVTFKIASGYITKMQNFALYETGDMVVNKIMKFTVNGKDVILSDDVVLKGNNTRKDYSCMGMWTEITFEMDVQIGENTIVLTSIFPDDGNGNSLYNDPGLNGTQSSFQLDTMMVSMGIHEHNYKNPTKVDDTNHAINCICGAKKIVAHGWDNGVETQAPTHLEAGVKTYTCTDCGHTKTEEIAKIAEHSFSKWTKVDDANHERSCECGEKETADHEWDNGVETQAPTHLEAGVKTFTCSTCQATKTEEIAKIAEHSFSKWTKVDDANHERSCECGEKETLAHTWDDGVITQNPTEEEEGIKLYSCADCGHTKNVSIGTLSHTHGFATEWSKDENHHWYATNCGHDNIEGVISKIAHNWNNGVETNAPTHLESGVKTYTCTDCGQTKTEEIPKTTEHSFGVWTKVDNETHNRVCECGEKEIKPHDWDSGVITQDPTENSNGEKICTCTSCGYTKTEVIDRIEVGDITSHNTVFTHNFTKEDQSAQNTNPPEGREDLTYYNINTTTSNNILKALALATDGDYLTHFYGGAAVTVNFTSNVSGKATVTFKIASGYFTYVSSKYTQYQSGDMIVNKIMKFTVNGKDIVIGDDVVLNGDSTTGDYSINGKWTDVSFEIDVKAGNNTIVLTSIFPDDGTGTGKSLYIDYGNTGTQSSFNLDTMTVNLTSVSYDLTADNDSLVHNFTAADQSAQNNNNPPSNRVNVSYVYTEKASSTAKNATKLATNEDYLGQFYGGAAVTYSFASSVSGKATITFKISSGYITKISDKKYETGDMVVNKVMKITVNGEEIIFGDDVVLNGDKTKQSYACMANWTYLTFEVDLLKGANTIVLTSLYPVDDDGNLLYKDYGETGTQSSFHLDTVSVALVKPDLSNEVNSFTHNYTTADQSARNNENPPQDRVNVNYVSTVGASATAQLATKLATNEDYLSHFYGGAAATKTFISTVAGKATVTFKIASGYLTKAENSVYESGDMVVNKVMKITVNGVDIVIGDDVVLNGDATTQTYACLANWTYVTFEIDVVEGKNTIVLTSLCPKDENGEPLYKDPGTDGTQSSFHLDTVTVTLK